MMAVRGHELGCLSELLPEVDGVGTDRIFIWARARGPRGNLSPRACNVILSRFAPHSDFLILFKEHATARIYHRG